MVSRPHWLLPAAMLLSVLFLAGCSGLPATDQQTPAPESPVDNFSYPSGWSQDGITDLDSAMRTNNEALETISHNSRLVWTDTDSNRTIVRTLDTDAGTGSARLVDTQLDADLHRYYSTNGVFEYNRTTEELSRMPDANWTAADVATVDEMKQSLRDLELQATETATVQGETAVRYSVTGIRNPDSVPANTASGHITVTEAGFIAAFDITRGNDDFTHQTTYELSAVGNATVTRPAWMPDE